MQLVNTILRIALSVTVAVNVGCSRLNTAYSPGFEVQKFESVKHGASEAEVRKMLGEPVEVYSHVQYSDGSINNVDGDRGDPRIPGSRVLNVAYRYSRPKSSMADYHVFEVLISDGKVVGKNRFTTD